jgi:hypothetical protein
MATSDFQKYLPLLNISKEVNATKISTILRYRCQHYSFQSFSNLSVARRNGWSHQFLLINSIKRLANNMAIAFLFRSKKDLRWIQEKAIGFEFFRLTYRDRQYYYYQ